MALDIGVRQEQGRRPYQEDEILVAPDPSSMGVTFEGCTHLFGIFDGHAGGKCSKFLSSFLHPALLDSKAYPINLKMVITLIPLPVPY